MKLSLITNADGNIASNDRHGPPPHQQRHPDFKPVYGLSRFGQTLHEPDLLDILYQAESAEELRRALREYRYHRRQASAGEAVPPDHDFLDGLLVAESAG